MKIDTPLMSMKKWEFSLLRVSILAVHQQNMPIQYIITSYSVGWAVVTRIRRQAHTNTNGVASARCYCCDVNIYIFIQTEATCARICQRVEMICWWWLIVAWHASLHGVINDGRLWQHAALYQRHNELRRSIYSARVNTLSLRPFCHSFSALN